jgi:hypothetical protein
MAILSGNVEEASCLEVLSSNQGLSVYLSQRNSKMLRKLFNDEAGFIISAELMIIITLLFCATVVGIAMIRDALVQELGDVSEMIGSFDQSYAVGSLDAPNGTGSHAHCGGGSASTGFGFDDADDQCDCQGVTLGDANTAGTKADPNAPGTLGTAGG